MKYHNLFAIGGLKNSGKDTAADMLQYLLNTPKILHTYFLYKIFKRYSKKGKYKITSFAHPLKRMLSILLSVPSDKFNNRTFKESYYVFFPTLTVTNQLPHNADTLSDNKFQRYLTNRDLSFIKTHWITIRQLLQVFGTECMRGIFGDKLWILATINNNQPMVISDLRFKVELDAVRSNSGAIIYIHRPGCKAGNHASEKELKEMYENKQFDYIINNNGTLKDLFNSMNKFVVSLSA